MDQAELINYSIWTGAAGMLVNLLALVIVVIMVVSDQKSPDLFVTGITGLNLIMANFWLQFFIDFDDDKVTYPHD